MRAGSHSCAVCVVFCSGGMFIPLLLLKDAQHYPVEQRSSFRHVQSKLAPCKAPNLFSDPLAKKLDCSRLLCRACRQRRTKLLVLVSTRHPHADR